MRRRASNRTEHAKGVDVNRFGHAALAEQLRRHVRHRPEALRADMGGTGVQYVTEPKVRKPAGRHEV